MNSPLEISLKKNLKKRNRKSRNSPNKKRKQNDQNHIEENESKNNKIPLVRNSDDPVPQKVKWTNKQRVLVFASRGITSRNRHLMEDLRAILPHSKPDNKFDKTDDLSIINEMAEIKNCNKCIHFVSKKHMDLYMWMSNIVKGPSIKFLVENVHTMKELKLTGNSLKGSRPLLCFDDNFSLPHYSIMKELITQIFSSPRGHPKTQPFFDHVFVFSLLDDKIWFRNYQITEEDGQLTEIGPRFVLQPIKIFDGSFNGATLWSNPKYVSPNQFRIDLKHEKSMKYLDSTNQKKSRAIRASKVSFIGDPTQEFFSMPSPSTSAPTPGKGIKKAGNKRKKIVRE